MSFLQPSTFILQKKFSCSTEHNVEMVIAIRPLPDIRVLEHIVINNSFRKTLSEDNSGSKYGVI